jgi:two-component system phosphate regulon response regulator PhoB
MTDPIRKPVVLLADDDPDYLYQIRFALEKNGYEVVASETQDGAESFLNTSKPDIAIFDLMMERDDSGFILAFHAKRRYPALPVIILTAVTAETGRKFGLTGHDPSSWIKADLYLEKGLLPDTLISHVNSLIRR